MTSMWIDFGNAEPLRFDHDNLEEQAGFIDGVRAAQAAWGCNPVEMFFVEPMEEYVPDYQEAAV